MQGLMVKNIIPSLREIGRIKIGRKGESRKTGAGGTFQLPEKLDHFLITKNYRDGSGNFVVDQEMHKMFGERPTEIPVNLIYDDIGLNFQCQWTCFNGQTRWCSGNGETANRTTNGKQMSVSCPCERSDPEYKGKDKCKLASCLSVLITDASRCCGKWTFRSTSYNSCISILSSLKFIQTMTGGKMAGLPLIMTLTPKQVEVDGKQLTVYIVNLEYNGSIEKLRDNALQLRISQRDYENKITAIEKEALLGITVDPILGDTEEEYAEEFFPQQTEDDDVGSEEQVSPENAGEKPKRKPRAKKTESTVVDQKPQQTIIDGIPDII